MKKGIFSILAIFLMIASFSISAFAHSGRTDSSGGHKDNKNVSGLGSYHYHCGGYPAHLHNGGVCPYKSTSSSSSSSSSNTSKKVYATSITAKNVPAKINVGENTKLEASVYPSNAEDKTISWESSDTKILTVDSVGNLTAVGVGTATITAKTSRGTSKKFTITVNEVVAVSISVLNNNTEIFLGDTRTLECEITPENTTNKTVIWTSSDETIISVSENGEITAKNPGKATITATHKELTNSIDVEVKPIDVENIEIVLPDDTETDDNGTPKVNKGSKTQLKAEILPENSTYKEIGWSVSDKTIATIDENGVLVANEAGTITITATAKSGVTKEIKIEVYSNDEDAAAVVVGGIVSFVIIGGGIAAWYYMRKKKKGA